MSLKVSDKERPEQRFHIDRKLTLAIIFFAIAGVLLMLLSNLATTTMSSLRAYTTLQGNWTREREEAAFHLYNYIDDGHDRSYQSFNEAVAYVRNVTRARELMEAESVDYSSVRNKLRKTGAHPEDIPGMIRTYVWLNGFSYFVDVVSYWERSDSLVYQMEGVAQFTQKKFRENASFTSRERDSLKTLVQELDNKLTEAQIGINNNLGMGVRLLESITFWSTTGAGVLLFVIGFLFTYRFRRSIKQWRNSLLRSEKRYRSLFNENPNAVYSLDTNGHFISWNEALEEMVGYSGSELEEMTFLPFVHPDYKEKVQEKFVQTLQGNPQSYEAVGLHRDGTEIHVHVTNLPIIIDGEIEGAYGIAQDITDRKMAEDRLRDSLEEKKTLLAEIHHRVKNNLAIISGLLELQANNLHDNKLKYDLLNTQSRIHSMAMVHERLYKSETLSSIRMETYVKDLAEAVRQTMNTDQNVHFDYDIEKINLDITQAIPCGLFLNEVIVNAFKYAFEGDNEGKISICMAQNDNEIILKVSDDGIGLPEDFDIREASTLGLSLINTLTKQLNGELHVESSNGTKYELIFQRKEAEFYQTGSLHSSQDNGEI